MTWSRTAGCCLSLCAPLPSNKAKRVLQICADHNSTQLPSSRQRTPSFRPGNGNKSAWSLFSTGRFDDETSQLQSTSHSSQAEYVSVCARWSERRGRTVNDIIIQFCMHSLRVLKVFPAAFSKENTRCAATMQRGRNHFTYCAAAYPRSCEEMSLPLRKNSTKAGRNGLI